MKSRIAGLMRPRVLIPSFALLLVLLLWITFAVETPIIDDASEPPAAGKITWVAKKGDLTLSTLSPGELKTRNTTQVVNFLEKQSKVLWIVEEGTQVRKGDKLVELDAADIQDSLLKQRIRNADVEQNLQKALDTMAITESKAKTDLLEAENRVEIATLDLRKYKEGDYLQDKRKKESAAVLAQEELKRAEDKFEWTKKLAEKGYVTQNDLEADEFAVTKSRIQLESAREDLQLLEKFTFERETSKLNTDLLDAKGDLERVNLTNAREIQSQKAVFDAARSTVDLENLNTRNLEDQISKAVIFAPEDGMVVFYKERYRGSETQLQIGAQVSPRQRLIDLPDFSSWMIEARVHESAIQRIKAGQPAFVTLDAFPDKLIEGTVAKISVLPDSADWWRNVQEYLVQIHVSAKEKSFKPGMSAKAEIIHDVLHDVLHLPIQAVTTRGGKKVVWVKGELGADLREVEIGANNDRFVQIISGIEEGQTVYLDQPATGSGVGERPSEKATEGQRGEAGEAANNAENSKAIEPQPAASIGAEGGSVPRGAGQGEGDPAARQKEMRERLEKMTPEERAQIEQRMKERRAKQSEQEKSEPAAEEPAKDESAS